jgi:hypothetical protein
MVDHSHGVFGESASESTEGGMIGSRIIKGKAQELFEGYSVVNLGFQLRVGIDLVPLLEQEAFHKDQGRIGFVAVGAFTDGVVSYE